MTGSAIFHTPEQLAANPPESWRVTRVQRGSRSWWEVRIHTDSDFAAATFTTKRAAMESILPGGRFYQVYEAARRWFAGEPVGGTAYRHHRPYAEVKAEAEKRKLAEQRVSERAGLPAEKMARWRELAGTADVADRAGELHDVLTEMLDWFDEARPLSLHSLTLPEAQETRQDLVEMFDLSTDLEDELHRVKVLQIGADRTATEVLEDLVQGERERGQLARLGLAG